MPWPLIMSVLPLVLMMGFIVKYELESEKNFKKKSDANKECIRPIAQIADELHVKKFGRHSTELDEVFPDLKAVK